MDDLRQAIIASAQRLQIDPRDLATVVSYETAGTFDPWKAGPVTQHGQHRGLIQWGEPQRQRYGVTQGMPVAAQMQAAERYLADAGFKPGMGMLDLYSAINAGKVGRYNASDAGNGGAPGTVRDKVEQQFGPHRAKAEAFLGGSFTPQAGSTAPGSAPVAPGPTSLVNAVAGAPMARPDDLGAILALADADPVKKQQTKLALRQQQEDADKARRAALFGGDGVASLYG